jgi:hypothetical protein
MAGRPRTKPRADTGTKRTTYKTKIDNSGKTVKENAALKSFWTNHKMEDIIKLSTKELDKKIDEWIIQFEAVQKKRDKFWWFPTIYYDPTPKKKGPKKINTKFNSSFSNK